MKAAAFLLVIPAVLSAQAVSDAKPAAVAGKVVNSVTGEPLRKVDLTLTTSLIPDGFGDMAKQFGLDDVPDLPNAPKPPVKPAEPKKSFSATTDASGKFRFEKIDPGDYYLKVKHTGFVDLNYKPAAKLAAQGRLHLTAGNEVVDLEIRLVPNGAVAGKVVDEDGDPVTDAMVTAMSFNYMMGHPKLSAGDTGQVNDRGEFRLGSLAPGRYYLCASKMADPTGTLPPPPKDGSKETGYVPSFFPGSTGVEQAEAIEVKAGSDLPGFVIHLQKSVVVRVKGTALTSDGKLVKNGMIMIMGGAGGFSAMRMVPINDPEGKFELSNLPPGVYTATVMQMGGSQTAMSMQPLVVPDHNVENVRLGVPPEGAVKGRIVTSGDGKVELKDVVIALEADEDSPTMPVMGKPDAGGAFVLSKVAPGRYTISLEDTPENTYTKSILWNGRDILGQTLDLTSGTAGDLQVMLGTDAGNVEVDVTRGDQAVEGASVVLLPADAGRRFPETTLEEDSDDHGHVRFQNVPPGSYLVLAWLDVTEGAWFDPAFVRRFENKAARLTVAAKGSEKLQVKLAEEAK